MRYAILLILFFMVITVVSSGDPVCNLNDAVFNFEDTFEEYDNEYNNVKKYFILQGKKILPFIKGKLSSKNISHKLFAKIITAEITIPYYIDGNKIRLIKSIYPKEIIESENEHNYSSPRHYRILEKEKYVSVFYDHDIHYPRYKLNKKYLKSSKVINVTPELIADYYWNNKNGNLFPIYLEFAKYPNKQILEFLITHPCSNSEDDYCVLFRSGVLTLGENIIPEARVYIKTISKKMSKIIATGKFTNNNAFKWGEQQKASQFSNIIAFTELLIKRKDTASRDDIKKIIENMLRIGIDNCEEDTCVSFFDILSEAKVIEALPAITALYINSLRAESREIHWDKQRVFGPRRHRKSSFFAYEYFLKRYGETAAKFLSSSNFTLPEIVKKEFKNNKIDEYIINSLRYALAGDIRKEKTRRLKVSKARKNALLYSDLKFYWKLHLLTGEDIYPKIQSVLTQYLQANWYRRNGQSQMSYNKFQTHLEALAMLKKLKERHAVSFLNKIIFTDNDVIMKELTGSSAWKETLHMSNNGHKYIFEYDEKKDVKLNPKLNLQLIRERGGAFGSKYKNIFMNLINGDFIIRVLRDIPTPSAKKALKQICKYQPFKKQAEVAIAYANKNFHKLLVFAKSKDQAYKDEASLILTEKHIKDYSRNVFRAAARRNAYDIKQWKGYVLDYSWKPREVVNYFAKNGNYREQVLANVMLLELNAPLKVNYYKKKITEGANTVSVRQSIRVDDIFDAGELLVMKKNNSIPVFDESFLPLLEYTAIFKKGIIRRGIAVAAISVFKKKTSLPILKDSLEMGSLKGDNPAVWALKKFKLPANDLSALIPPPVPGEADVGLKMTKFRGGTQVLASNKDVRGIDNIVKGLETLLADYNISMWEYRANIFLKSASNYMKSPKIQRILMKILKNNDDQVWLLHNFVFRLLMKNKIHELSPLLLKEIASIILKAEKFKKDPKYQYELGEYRIRDRMETILIGLLLIHMDKLPDILLKKYREFKKDDIIQKKQFLLAMTSLSYANGGFVPELSTILMSYIIDKKKAKEIAHDMREKVLPLLLDALKSKNKNLNQYAAKLLLSWSFNTDSDNNPIRSDSRGAQSLFEWSRKNKVLLYNSVNFFKSHIKENELCEFLCDMYKEGKNSEKDFLDQAKYPPFTLAVCKYINTYYHKNPKEPAIYDIHYLHPSNKIAQHFLLRILKENLYNQDYQVEAAKILGKAKYKPAAKLTYDLLIRILKGGPDSKKIIRLSFQSKKSIFKDYVNNLLQVLLEENNDLANKAAEFAIIYGDKSIHGFALRILINKKEKTLKLESKKS